MIIQSFVFNKNQVNTYIVSDEITKETIIIDCGCTSHDEFNKIVRYVDENHLNIKYSICTHLHFDHMFGINYLYDKFLINTIACNLDIDMLEWNKLCSVFMELSDQEKELLSTNHIIWIKEPFENLTIGDNIFTIILTPGHSPGSISLYCETKMIVFCGDVLFRSGQGRTDFDGGNTLQLMESIKYLLSLNEEALILSGHYQPFKVKERKRMQPCNEIVTI